MRLRPERSMASLGRQAGAFVAAALLVAGCATAAQTGASGSPDSSSSASPSAGSSAGPSGSSTGSGFYLRAWQTQALAPQYTFAWLSIVTISDGQLIDGMGAVPAVYPGPLWIGPSERSISPAGISSIVAEARAAGMLGAKRDFADNVLAGAITGHVQMVVDGVTYDLTGDPSALTRCRCIPDPGTPGAFAAFWQKLMDTASWLGGALGPESAYDPASLAVLAMPPVESSASVAPNETPWPLATPFASFGTPYGGAGNRCAVVSGADLARLLPVVKQSNQLTRFVDSQGVKNSLLVRVLVPREPSPCA